MRHSFFTAILWRGFVVLAAALLAIKGFDLAFPARGLSVERPEAVVPGKRVPPVSPTGGGTEDGPPSTVPAGQVSVAPSVSDADHEEQVRARIEQLMDLAMNDDANSLKTIWSELSNPDKDIRAGALAAVVQFGDRSVVPNLRALAEQTDDPAEKANILAAADHLALPTLIELHRAQQGQPAGAPRAAIATQQQLH
jgi:hypothetical protein